MEPKRQIDVSVKLATGSVWSRTAGAHKGFREEEMARVLTVAGLMSLGVSLIRRSGTQSAAAVKARMLQVLAVCPLFNYSSRFWVAARQRPCREKGAFIADY